MKKVIYSASKIELGSLNESTKELFTNFWLKASKDDLERFGLEIVDDGKEEPKSSEEELVIDMKPPSKKK